jgi:hypothetical protein
MRLLPDCFEGYNTFTRTLDCASSHPESSAVGVPKPNPPPDRSNRVHSTSNPRAPERKPSVSPHPL